jgi:hypothetical protein
MELQVKKQNIQTPTPIKILQSNEKQFQQMRKISGFRKMIKSRSMKAFHPPFQMGGTVSIINRFCVQ